MPTSHANLSPRQEFPLTLRKPLDSQYVKKLRKDYQVVNIYRLVTIRTPQCVDPLQACGVLHGAFI